MRFTALCDINLKIFIMKKRNLNSLKLNKVAISQLRLTGGRPPHSHGCGVDPVGPSDDDFVWFTDAAQRACETFDGTGCF